MKVPIEKPVDPDYYRPWFAKAVRPLMTEKNLSATVLAEMAGVSRMSFHRYLSGEQFPSKEVSKRIAEAVLVPWEEFEKAIVTREMHNPYRPIRVRGISRKTLQQNQYEDSCNAFKRAREDGKALGIKPDLPRHMIDYLAPIPSGGFMDYEDVDEILKEMGWVRKNNRNSNTPSSETLSTAA